MTPGLAKTGKEGSEEEREGEMAREREKKIWKRLILAYIPCSARRKGRYIRECLKPSQILRTAGGRTFPETFYRLLYLYPPAAVRLCDSLPSFVKQWVSRVSWSLPPSSWPIRVQRRSTSTMPSSARLGRSATARRISRIPEFMKRTVERHGEEYDRLRRNLGLGRSHDR